MINLLIPMAGLGSRFAKAGYSTPKPFIEVNGVPMIELVIRNLYRPGMGLYLLARDTHVDSNPDIIAQLEAEYGAVVVPVDRETEGTACTILFARKYIDNDNALLIANSDQLVDFEVSDYLADAEQRELDGSILVFRDSERNPKWSFAQTDEQGHVVRVKEKEAISDLATVGIYLFGSGARFVDGCVDMICRRDTVNGEYYTCPVYNYLVGEGGRVGVYEVAESDMHGLGTPEDLDRYLQGSA